MTYELMQQRQLRLSIVLAVVFLVTMFSIPFLNEALMETMITPVLGIPFIWLAVGILLHLVFWVIAISYTVASNRWEREVAESD